MKHLALCLLVTMTASTFAAERPNIIFMLADDQGWDGLSVAMHPEVVESKGEIYHTPNLERLASQGMRFSAAYAPAPVCSPTRISLMTGKSPAALHWTKAAPPETGRRLVEPRGIRSLADGETTIGELLSQLGYATAHFGKWHIAGGGPQRHGFQVSDGDTGNEQAYRFTDPNPVDIFGMAERATAFMEQNAQANRPFFIQLSWNALHAAENARKATLAKYEQKLGDSNRKRIATAAITEDLDAGVGKVLDAVDRLGLSSKTFVIYMSDNGAGGGKRFLKGGKGDVYEGGIRVPLIIRGPGVAANSWCHTRVVGYDFFPTFCEWAGCDRRTLPKGIEGGSIVSLLAISGPKSPPATVHRAREEMVFHFPHYQGHTPHSAILLGDLKLVHFYEDDHDELYDLARDMRERQDLAAQRPEDVRRLRDRLQSYLSAVDAQLPTRNSGDDAGRAPPTVKRNGKKKAARSEKP
jgi:arylsulfatase A